MPGMASLQTHFSFSGGPMMEIMYMKSVKILFQTVFKPYPISPLQQAHSRLFLQTRKTMFGVRTILLPTRFLVARQFTLQRRGVWERWDFLLSFKMVLTLTVHSYLTALAADSLAMELYSAMKHKLMVLNLVLCLVPFKRGTIPISFVLLPCYNFRYLGLTKLFRSIR